MKRPRLIIGYGNRLRGDDGVGPAAADVVRSWNLPDVRVVSVQQLLPELIEELAHAQQVLFIDAVADDRAAYYCRLIDSGASRRTLGHYQTPAGLLALLRDLAGCVPHCWLLTIAASSFGYQEELSEIAQANLQAALVYIHNWFLDVRMPGNGPI